MNIFHRFVFLFAALGPLVCSCGGRRVAEAAGDAGEPAFLEIFERPEGGWTAVSVSPFDGSRDTLVIDRPLSRLIVMSTSHYGFLDALDATDRIVGISGPDYLYLSTGLAASETSSGGSTALFDSRQALTVRTPRFARSLPSLGEVVKASLHLLSFDLGPSLLRDEGVHGPDMPDLPTASEKREAVGASLDGETHATLGTVRGGTGAERSVASGGAERSEAVEPPEVAAAASTAYISPMPAGTILRRKVMQIVPDEPDLPLPMLLYSYEWAITHAKKYIWFQTPYFVPPEPVLDAMKIAALTGIDIRLMLPEAADNFIARPANRAYYEEILGAGVRLFLRQGEFIHSKTFVCDDYLSSIGSANMDARSFGINYEINTYIYDEEAALMNKAIFEKDLEKCRELTLEEWSRRPWYKRLLESVIRLFAPLL